jgi:hypothetical protein
LHDCKRAIVDPLRRAMFTAHLWPTVVGFPSRAT